MNKKIISEIDSARKRMSGYVVLMDYRFRNLCVKADIASLLPVSIYLSSEEANIEEVAYVTKEDDFTMGVYPKDPSNLQEIIEGIYEAHPEFKMESKSDGDNETSRYLTYTMPEVDKNRHDFLTEGVKGLYQECCARIDAVYGEYQASFAQAFVNIPPEQADEANQALDETHEKCRELADGILDKKNDEIEEAYARYLDKEAEKQGAEDEFKVTQTFKLPTLESDGAE